MNDVELFRLSEECGIDAAQLKVVLKVLTAHGWCPPLTHSDIKFKSRRSAMPCYRVSDQSAFHVSEFPVLEGDR